MHNLDINTATNIFACIQVPYDPIRMNVILFIFNLMSNRENEFEFSTRVHAYERICLDTNNLVAMKSMRVHKSRTF